MRVISLWQIRSLSTLFKLYPDDNGLLPYCCPCVLDVSYSCFFLVRRDHICYFALHSFIPSFLFHSRGFLVCTSRMKTVLTVKILIMRPFTTVRLYTFMDLSSGVDGLILW